MRRRLLLLVFVSVASLYVPLGRADEAKLEHFEKKIRPVLIAHCYECHSADAARTGKLKAGLQLDTRAGLIAGGESGSAIVPGEPGKSLLITALRFETQEMPPSGKLPEAVIADFEAWIADGAVDPREGQPAKVREPIDLVKAREFWSLRPVHAPAVPATLDTAWPAGDIDRFVLAGLEKQQLHPSPPAERAVLLRRLHFDLIGLPPRISELETFLADDSPEAVANVVDRLLASPHFGERWGRHWLDLARYSESCGSTRNVVWHHAWRYRDYVIDAVNRDLPYDQFLREQIAGDLLTASTSEERDRQLVAAGFLALGPKALDEAKREVFRMDAIDEQIDTVSRVVLGLSVACARCHDHKFDPIPTRDYYALAGIFRSTDALYGPGPRGIRGTNDAELQPIGPRATELSPAAAEHARQVAAQVQARNDARSDRYRVVRKVADVKRQLLPGGADQSALQAEIDRMEAEIKEWDEKIKALDQQLAALIDNPPPQPQYALSARDYPQGENCRVHLRGETTNLGDEVPRGVVQVLDLPTPAIGERESGRLQLAQWLTDRNNPLTARVQVNRVWQHLFGRGIVATPDDFGINGARPTHPELLDHLAARFVASGWSLKQLIRELVLSRTYQQASSMSAAANEVDPDNVWLWRMRPRRLEAEALRDAVLSVSGQLDPQPLETSVVAGLHVFRQDEFVAGYELTPQQLEHNRRSVYLPIVRGNSPELLKLFDFADPARAVALREETIVPAQASYLMNSPWMIEQAERLAERVQGSSADDQRRIEQLYLLALSRSPSDAERARCLAFLAAGDAAARKSAWTTLSQALLASSEFRYLR